MTDRMPASLSVRELPPRPDSRTGEPAPPHAPEYDRKGDTKGPWLDPHHPKAPSPPEGQGPVLAWYRTTNLRLIQTAAVSLLLMAAGITFLQGFDPTWLTYWQPWAVVIVFSIFATLAVRTTDYSVGADWLQGRKGRWVKLYELESINGELRGTVLHLNLRDRDGRAVLADTRHLKHTRLMWDLVYNGILHSAVAGEAELNANARGGLLVPYPRDEDRGPDSHS